MSYSKEEEEVKNGTQLRPLFQPGTHLYGPRIWLSPNGFNRPPKSILSLSLSLSLSLFCFYQLKLFHNNPLIPFILMRKLLCTIQVYFSYLQKLLSPH